MIRVLHNIESIGKRSYGLGAVVLNLVEAQARCGTLDPEVWSLDDEAERAWGAGTVHLAEDRLRGFRRSWPARAGYSLDMVREASTPRGGGFQVVHQHNLWLATSLFTNRWHRKTGMPTVVTPHGGLHPDCLKVSAAKKRLAMLLYQGRCLREAGCIHALSPEEAKACRAFGLDNPIAVIPNGVPAAWMDLPSQPAAFRESCGLPAGARMILFLSRVHPEKGIPLLLEAMAMVGDEGRDWHLVVAGPDQGHEAECRALAAKLSLTDRVRFTGPLYGEAKRSAFAAADLFVLPSYYEASPIVVLEALGAGVPVICTQAAPWRELLDHRCGWWPPISAPGIAEALAEAVRLPQAALADMGARGRALVQAQYTWEESARKTGQLYEWLCGMGPRPGFMVD